MDHYEVLGVARNARAAEIRKAYLDAVLPRPEAALDDARRRAAAQAWAVLRDPERRAAYDARLGLAPPATPAVPARAEREPAPADPVVAEPADSVVAEPADPVVAEPVAAPPAPAARKGSARARRLRRASEPPRRRPHPPMPEHVPVVPAEREPSRLRADRPGLPAGSTDRNDLGSRFASLMPPAVIGLGVVILLLALLLSSAGLLLTGLILLAVGVTSFILVPLVENINIR